MNVRELIERLEEIAAEHGNAIPVYCCDNADNDYVMRHSLADRPQVWTIEPHDPLSPMKELRFAGASDGETIIILTGEP